jgi:hypothetical protein
MIVFRVPATGAVYVHVGDFRYHVSMNDFFTGRVEHARYLQSLRAFACAFVTKHSSIITCRLPLLPTLKYLFNTLDSVKSLRAFACAFAIEHSLSI